MFFFFPVVYSSVALPMNLLMFLMFPSLEYKFPGDKKFVFFFFFPFLSTYYLDKSMDTDLRNSD